MKKNATRIPLIAAVLCLGVGVFAGTAGAQDDLVGDREITVTPDQDLSDGQTVTVEWSGFTPDSSVTVIQCADAAGLKSETCNTGAAVFDLGAGPEGEGSTELTVHTGETGPDGRCDGTENNNCVIAANEDLEDGVTATAPIQFAADADVAPAEASGGTEELAETGSGNLVVSLVGAALVMIGGAFLAASRRRLAA